MADTNTSRVHHKPTAAELLDADMVQTLRNLVDNLHEEEEIGLVIFMGERSGVITPKEAAGLSFKHGLRHPFF